MGNLVLKGGHAVGWLFAAVFAVLLLALPANTDRYFAWTSRPPIAAAWIGAAYIFRVSFFTLNLRENRWSRVRVFQWGNFVFSAILIAATLLHRSRFNWNLPSAWIWLVLYVAEPLWVLYLLGRHRSEAEQTGGAVLTAGTRTILSIQAVLFLLVGLALFLLPAQTGAAWPWSLTPLNARAMAAWPLGWAVWSLMMSRESGWEAIRLAVITQIVFGLGLLFHFALYLGQMDFARPVTWAYVVALVALTVWGMVLLMRKR